MRLSIALISLACTVGCLQPVDPKAQVLVACTGSCPFGACSDGCADAGTRTCATADECIEAFSCNRNVGNGCSAYTAERFQLGMMPTACATTPGSYCATTLSAGGVRGVFAVDCVDGGQTIADCSSATYCTDAGSSSPRCRAVCGPRYCVR